MRNLMTVTALSLLVACGGAETPSETPEPVPTADAVPADAATMAATIAKEVRAAPGEAAAVLEKHGMSTEDFEGLLYEVAADADLSAKYLAALE